MIWDVGISCNRFLRHEGSGEDILCNCGFDEDFINKALGKGNKMNCPFLFRSPICGFTGPIEASCDGSFEQCKSNGNETRWGGHFETKGNSEMTNQREKYARLYNVWKKLGDRCLDDRQIITNAGHKNVLRWLFDGTRRFEHDDAVWELNGLYCLADFYNIPETAKPVEYIHPGTLELVRVALDNGFKVERSLTKNGVVFKWALTKRVHDDYLTCRYRIIAGSGKELPEIQNRNIKKVLKDMIEKLEML